MVDSGVTCTEEIGTAFNDINRSEARFMVAAFDGDTTIKLETKGERSATFADFQKAMEADEPRYAVYDLEWDSAEGRHQRKVLFIVFIPDGSKVADKFKYSNGKTTFRSKIGHVNKDVTINDRLDLTEAYLLEQFK